MKLEGLPTPITSQENSNGIRTLGRALAWAGVFSTLGAAYIELLTNINTLPVVLGGSGVGTVALGGAIMAYGGRHNSISE